MAGLAQQVTSQDIDKILERADTLLDESKAAYESARSKNSVEAFVDAGFKLEEARIKYLVLQEIGSADKQKIAADRLRAVNQLAKLIHDGKVAITGSPVESPAAKAAEANPPEPLPAAKDPPPNPAPSPARPAVDVTKRAPVPEAAKQREAEKLIKDLFKDKYAKKSPADRKALARHLLDQAAKSQDDLAATWVLCREAQDAAVQSGDVRTLISAIEMAASVFDVDAMSMRTAALTAAGRMAKTPDEFSELIQPALRLVDELVASDQYDSADKVAGSAVQYARKTNDLALVTRVMNRAKEVGDAKTSFQAMKSVLETLAKNPEDPRANLAMGKFLCYFKGNWDFGLRFLAKGADEALKAIAERDLASPKDPEAQAAIAEDWWSLGEKQGAAKGKVQERSLFWSKMAWGALKGLKREKLRARFKAVYFRPAGRNYPEIPARWINNGWPGKISVDETYAHAGQFSVKHTPPSIFSATSVSAAAGREYVFTAWVLSEETEGRDFFAAEILDAQGKLFATLSGPESTLPTDTPFWTMMTYKFMAPPQTGVIRMTMFAGSKNGRIWLDDLSLKALNEGAEMILNGGFEERGK
jgi:hypothetical protein